MTAVATRGQAASIAKIDRRILELWRVHLNRMASTTAAAYPAHHARLWRQIDDLLDKRLELTG